MRASFTWRFDCDQHVIKVNGLSTDDVNFHGVLEDKESALECSSESDMLRHTGNLFNFTRVFWRSAQLISLNNNNNNKSYFPPCYMCADACADSLPNVHGFLEAEFLHCGIPGSHSSFFCSRSADLRLCLFVLEWEEQLLCKQAVLHLDVMVHENSSAESVVTSLADPVRWSICASVTA